MRCTLSSRARRVVKRPLARTYRGLNRSVSLSSTAGKRGVLVQLEREQAQHFIVQAATAGTGEVRKPKQRQG